MHELVSDVKVQRADVLQRPKWNIGGEVLLWLYLETFADTFSEDETFTLPPFEESMVLQNLPKLPLSPFVARPERLSESSSQSESESSDSDN